jgi:hypothetical protein
MRAVHGRYFFAIVPFLLLGIGGPAALLARQWRWREAAWLALAVTLGATEAAFFVWKVIPFYRTP